MRASRFVIAMFFAFTVISSHAQDVVGTPYADAAAFLASLSPDGQVADGQQVIAQILSFYSSDNTITEQNVIARMQTMPFLKDFAGRLKSLSAEGDSTTLGGIATGSGGGIMGLDVTNLADGIAKFLIERGKQELSMAFFNRFRDDLRRYPELRTLFPVTNGIIDEIEAHNVLNLLQELRDAFIKDLLHIPSGILNLRSLGTGDCPAGDNTCASRITALRAAFSTDDSRGFVVPLIVIQGIINGDNIIEILDNVTADTSVASRNDDLSGALKLSTILLESFLTDNNSSGVFINRSEVRNLFVNKDLLKVFLGLVYQRILVTRPDWEADLRIRGANLEALFNAILAKNARFQDALSSFDKINSAYKNLKSSLEDGQAKDVSFYTAITSASIDLLIRINDAIDVIAPGADPVFRKKLVANLNIVNQVCSDIQVKNYAGIFNGSIKLIADNALITDDKTREKVIKYLSFGANLASATNSDEVKNAIDAVSLPPGSYSIKSRSSFNLSLNGYIGYNWDFNSGLYANGIYAPVGIAASIGLSKKHGGALTLFTSLIDVGGVVAYRLKNGNTDDLKQEVRLESIVAPSAQLFFLVPKTPIAFGAGWRRTPKLFYKSNTDFTVVQSRSVLSLSVLIDIPIFNLKTVPFD